MQRIIPGAFGTAPKDHRPEKFPSFRAKPGFRARERAPMVSLAGNSELLKVGEKISDSVLKGHIPTIEAMIEDFKKSIISDNENIKAAYALIAEEAARPGREAYDNVKALQADIVRFKLSLQANTIGLARAQNTLEYAQKL